MKKGNLIFTVLISALIIAIGCIAISFADESNPGTASDPIVTKAYVDKAIDKAIEELNSSASVSASQSPAVSSWEVVFVETGKSITGGQGTEIIVRSGQAEAIDNGANGLSDLTSGTEPKGGEKVVNNHLLLVPKADGRGLKITEDAWLMVLGSYEIKAE